MATKEEDWATGGGRIGQWGRIGLTGRRMDGLSNREEDWVNREED